MPLITWLDTFRTGLVFQLLVLLLPEWTCLQLVPQTSKIMYLKFSIAFDF